MGGAEIFGSVVLALAFLLLALGFLFWPRGRACRRCQGRGWIIVRGEDPRWQKTETCPLCEGRRIGI